MIVVPSRLKYLHIPAKQAPERVDEDMRIELVVDENMKISYPKREMSIGNLALNSSQALARGCSENKYL